MDSDPESYTSTSSESSKTTTEEKNDENTEDEEEDEWGLQEGKETSGFDVDSVSSGSITGRIKRIFASSDDDLVGSVQPSDEEEEQEEEQEVKNESENIEYEEYVDFVDTEQPAEEEMLAKAFNNAGTKQKTKIEKQESDEPEVPMKKRTKQSLVKHFGRLFKAEDDIYDLTDVKVENE